MGPNKVQFWVGDFDGNSFHLDSTDNLYTGKNIPGEVFDDFESGTYGTWTITGTAFGNMPSTGTLPAQQEVNGFIGRKLINSFVDGDPSTGKMVSPDFIIEKNFINYLIGGGNVNGIEISLWVDGTRVLTGKSLKSQEMLRWDGWEVSAWKGQTAHIEILDDATGGWGHILLDQIVFSDELYDTHFENANWADWGKDFYAARSYRNYDNPQVDSTMWIAWMGNWAYANNIPTTPWKGHQAIPRVLKLFQNENGYQLRQYPIGNLTGLRTEPFTLNETLISGSLELTGFKPEWNVYELKLSFKIDNRNQKFGVSLADDGQGKKLVIGYDAWSSKLFIDRRTAGLVNFSQAFPAIMYAPTPFPSDSIMDLHIYLDQSSVEVFANKNQTTLSALVFTKPPSTGVSLFSENESVTLLGLEAWKLNSIWGVTPDQLPNDIKESPTKGGQGIRLFPNPLKKGDVLSVIPSEDMLIHEGTVEITDLYGRLVKTEILNNIPLSAIRIDGLPDFRRGSYFFRLKSQSISLVEKFVIL
jgi:fructan beta-fructosidase